MTDEAVPGRRLFLHSLVGATVGYCFLQSVPVIGQGASIIAFSTPTTVLSTDSFAALLAETYSRDRVFAPFERSLSRYYDEVR